MCAAWSLAGLEWILALPGQRALKSSLVGDSLIGGVAFVAAFVAYVAPPPPEGATVVLGCCGVGPTVSTARNRSSVYFWKVITP